MIAAMRTHLAIGMTLSRRLAANTARIEKAGVSIDTTASSVEVPVISPRLAVGVIRVRRG